MRSLLPRESLHPLSASLFPNCIESAMHAVLRPPEATAPVCPLRSTPGERASASKRLKHHLQYTTLAARVPPARQQPQAATKVRERSPVPGRTALAVRASRCLCAPPAASSAEPPGVPMPAAQELRTSSPTRGGPHTGRRRSIQVAATVCSRPANPRLPGLHWRPCHRRRRPGPGPKPGPGCRGPMNGNRIRPARWGPGTA